MPAVLDRARWLVAPPPGQTAEDQLGAGRTRLLPAAEVVQLIRPAVGSTVLDLGAGYGLYTLMLGETVGPQGTVYATDVDSRPLAYIASQAGRHGIANVVPVRVRADGFDAFYERQVFDYVLAADVIPLIGEPEAFFARLRPRVRDVTGRLWVVDLRLDPDFTPLEVDDDAVMRALAGSSAAQVIVARLGAPLRDVLAAPQQIMLPDAFPGLLAAALNQMLEDPTLWTDARALDARLSAREEMLRRHLDGIIQREQASARGSDGTSQRATRARRLLNRLLLQDLLAIHGWEQAFGLDRLTWPQWEPLLAQIENGHDYEPLLGGAGFALVREHPPLPYHRVWEFRRAK